MIKELVHRTSGFVERGATMSFQFYPPDVSIGVLFINRSFFLRKIERLRGLGVASLSATHEDRRSSPAHFYCKFLYLSITPDIWWRKLEADCCSSPKQGKYRIYPTLHPVVLFLIPNNYNNISISSQNFNF